MRQILHITLLVAVFLMTSWNLNCQEAEHGGGMLIMNWNLENYFDWIDGGYSDSDAEFSSRGVKRWTKSRFMAKSNAIAKTILWIGDRYGNIPDIVCFEEVENRNVLRRLTEDTALRKKDYRIVHFDSPDRRGIDVALLYRGGVFEALETRAVQVGDTAVFRTRDILLVRLERRCDGKTLSVLVNHHPSKFGGGDSDWKRMAAVETMKAVSDSLRAAGESFIVSTGDFNDTPENRVLGLVSCEYGDTAAIRNGKLVNLALPLVRSGRGTIRFNGKWELIDMFLVSGGVADAGAVMEIVEVPFLLTHDNTHSGDKPLRTYLGPRYLGGVSDHLPVVLRITARPYRRVLRQGGRE